MHRKLEAAVNLAILFTCVAIIATLAMRLWGTPASRAATPTMVRSGDSVRVLSRVDWSKAEQTLLLVLRADCQYCISSMPFYAELSRRVREQPSGRVQLVVLTSDSMQTAMTSLKENQLEVARIITLSMEERRGLNVPGTPTLIAVDSVGEVTNAWFGKLDATGEAQVMTHLFEERRVKTDG